MLRNMQANVKLLADGKYLVRVIACDTGTGEERASYDNLGKIAEGDVAALQLLSRELNTAGGRVANLNMPLPFKKDEKKEAKKEDKK